MNKAFEFYSSGPAPLDCFTCVKCSFFLIPVKSVNYRKLMSTAGCQEIIWNVHTDFFSGLNLRKRVNLSSWLSHFPFFISCSVAVSISSLMRVISIKSYTSHFTPLFSLGSKWIQTTYDVLGIGYCTSYWVREYRLEKNVKKWQWWN